MGALLLVLASRIVSLDYCADQYVLRLAEPDRILAVSPDAGKSFSYMREAAEGVPRVRPRAEDFLVLEPDLVVRSYAGGPNLRAFLDRAGVELVEVRSGDPKEVLRRMGAALGAVRRAEELVREVEKREAALARKTRERTLLYMTAGGVTTGPGTRIHDMIRASGFENFQRDPGWRPLPLERLAYERPDRIAVGDFETDGRIPGSWSAIRHPVAQAALGELPVSVIPGAWTACGGWFLLDAVEALAAVE